MKDAPVLRKRADAFISNATAESNFMVSNVDAQLVLLIRGGTVGARKVAGDYLRTPLAEVKRAFAIRSSGLLKARPGGNPGRLSLFWPSSRKMLS